ncbi:MAG: hypothetical protein BGO06_19945 [Shinella sp. 65-6]|nr:MAG: hypothetical protein BGO06_19945 [Shinella sp. 65-6]
MRAEVLARDWPSLFGDMRVDAATNHAALPFLLGRINDGHGFDVIAAAPALAADPYLTGATTRPAPRLRIVS